VEDAASPNDKPNSNPKGTKKPRRRDRGLGAALAVLRAVLGDRIPIESLGPETVPSSVLAIPIALATDQLVEHARKCRNLACPHVPPPLQRYRRGNRPDAIRKASEEVHKVLWTHPDHELVVWIRRTILEKNVELAKEISTGSVLNGDRLGKLLDELGSEGPRLLAAILWASEFDGPDAEALFRSLIPLATDGVSPRPSKIVNGSAGQVKALQADLRKVRREMTQVKRTARDLSMIMRRPVIIFTESSPLLRDG
jgi:hypothetical protein